MLKVIGVTITYVGGTKHIKIKVEEESQLCRSVTDQNINNVTLSYVKNKVSQTFHVKKKDITVPIHIENGLK